MEKRKKSLSFLQTSSFSFFMDYTPEKGYRIVQTKWCDKNKSNTKNEF